jgi:hypothetical protein
MANRTTNDPTVDDTTVAEVESIVASTVGGTVTEVEWWAHRLLGSDGRSIVVYRVTIAGSDGNDSTDHEAYYVVIGDFDSAVYPVEAYDSVVNLVSAYRADDGADLVR